MKQVATGNISDESLFKSFSHVGSATVILFGSLALAGWILNIDTLKSILPGAVTMKANTAVGFLLAGISLWLALSDQTDRFVHRLGQAFAVGVVLIGLLTLIEYLSGWNLGIDQLLIKESVNAVATFSPGRMALNTAFNFLLLGLGLLFLDWETRGRHRPAHYLIITASLISILGLLGYAYGVKELYGFLNYTKMAINTAVAFTILCFSMLYARPRAGLMVAITSQGMSALLMRRLLLLALIVPAGAGWIRLLGERAGQYDTAFGISLTVITDTAIFVIMILLTARKLNRVEDNLRRSYEDLQTSQADLKMQNDELLRAHDELGISREKYRHLYDDAPVGYLTFDEIGLILTANMTAANLLGVERDSLIKKPFPQFIFEEEQDIFCQHSKKLFETGAPQADDLRMKRKDGELCWMHIETIQAQDSDGALVGRMALSDFSVRKEVENMLKKEQSFSEAIINSIPGTFYVIDENGRYVRGNKYQRDEIVGKTDTLFVSTNAIDTIHSDDRALVQSAIINVMQRGIESQVEGRVLMHGGPKFRWFLMTGQQIVLDGHPFLVGTGIDITARKQADLKLAEQNQILVHRLQNIQALQKIEQAIAGSLDLKLTLRVVLEQTKAELHVDAASILLFNPHSQVFEFAAGIGFHSKAFERSRLHLGEGPGGRAALERRTVSVTNLLENSDQFLLSPLLLDEGFVTYFGTPLIAKGLVRGVLEVFHRSPFIPNQDWLDFLEVLAGQTAVAVDSANLFADLQQSNAELFTAYDSTIEGWSHALDLRDKETEGHTLRVTEITMKLASAAGITDAELVHVRRGALLHDIGKMGVPDSILLKQDKLTDEEWGVMRKHPIFAFELLSPIAYLRPALDIPYCHHEKWDGSGYPRGLKGEQIPLAARLFAIIDVWDALLSDRPYRQAWSNEKVTEHIKSLSGTHFEPKAVELFLNMISEDEKNAG